MSKQYVLKARYGPPDKVVNGLYRETPRQEGHVVRVKYIESAQRLMQIGYDLIEDPKGDIDPSKKPLTPSEAASALGIARPTVYKKINDGELEADQDENGRWRIPQSAVDNYRS